MKPTCSICDQPIVVTAAGALPPGVCRGIFYPHAHVAWMPELSPADTRDGTGDVWQFLHVACAHAINTAFKPSRPY